MPAPIRPTRAFGPPRALSSPDRQPARPYLLADGTALHLVWKEFDGTKVAGALAGLARQRPQLERRRAPSPTPTTPRTIRCSSPTTARAYLSWLTKAEGYRLIPLEDQP